MKSINQEHLVILNSLLYLLNKTDKPLSRHKLFKLLYFADKIHLRDYGRPITTDRYVAMKYGPVPSIAYSFIQTLEGNNSYMVDYIPFLKRYLQLSGKHEVTAVSPFDPDELPNSAMGAMDLSFKENYKLSFKELTRKSHDLAWEKAENNSNMDYRIIAKAADAVPSTLAYLKRYLENQKIVLLGFEA